PKPPGGVPLQARGELRGALASRVRSALSAAHPPGARQRRLRGWVSGEAIGDRAARSSDAAKGPDEVAGTAAAGQALGRTSDRTPAPDGLEEENGRCGSLSSSSSPSSTGRRSSPSPP